MSVRSYCSCILSKFHIKPQPGTANGGNGSVVSYRNSTSNHNMSIEVQYIRQVVSYRNSTSNHNNKRMSLRSVSVVSYRNSTSNHNCEDCLRRQRNVVSYRNSTSNHNSVCVIRSVTPLYLIEIPHQTTTENPAPFVLRCCILSKFHIKPQRGRAFFYRSLVVSYRNSTSNHNDIALGAKRTALYLIEIPHQTTTVGTVSYEFTMLYLIEIPHQTTTSGLILIDKVLLTGCLPL